MKKGYYVMVGLIVLGLIITFVLLAISPDIVPVHWNIKGEPDRFGSKYEHLLFPAIILISGIIFILTAKTKKINATDKKTVIIIGISIISFFIILASFLMIKAITYDATVHETSTSISKIITIGLGVLLIVLGNIMPKVKMNGYMGLRCSWSMYNDITWQKSQRFAAYTFVFVGFITIILSMFLSELVCLVVFMILLITSSVVSLVASYKYYQQQKSIGSKS